MDLSINIDMGLIFFVLLPVLGAALVVGGVIAYRVSKTGMAKAFSAASIVSGIAMWLVLASVTITSSSGTAPAPTIVTAVKSDEALGLSEQTFLHLLLAEDVQPMLSEEALLTTSYENLREIEGNKNPENVANINSWFGLTIENDGSPDSISFALMDFDSSTAASAYFEKTRISKKAIPEVEAAYGGSSYSVEMNFLTIGSMLVVVNGDKVILLQTVKPEDQPALFTLDNLDELATLVVSRL